MSPPSQGATTTPRSPTTRGGRPSRKIVQPTRLEAVDGTLDPLGPLGAAPSADVLEEQGPTPPRKEPAASRRPLSSTPQQNMSQSMMSSIDLNDESNDGVRGKMPPPVQPPTPGESAKRQTQPSMSVEQAAKPSFNITVGDPHKVGDLTSSHIVYQVRTQVSVSASLLTRIPLMVYRQRRRHIDSRTLQSVGGIVTSYGFTINYTATIQELLSHLHQKSKLLVDLIRILWSREERHWNECSTRQQHIRFYNMTVT